VKIRQDLVLEDNGFGRFSDYPEDDLWQFYLKIETFDFNLYRKGLITVTEYSSRNVYNREQLKNICPHRKELNLLK